MKNNKKIWQIIRIICSIIISIDLCLAIAYFLGGLISQLLIILVFEDFIVSGIIIFILALIFWIISTEELLELEVNTTKEITNKQRNKIELLTFLKNISLIIILPMIIIFYIIIKSTMEVTAIICLGIIFLICIITFLVSVIKIKNYKKRERNDQNV